MSGAKPQLLQYAFMVLTRKTLPFFIFYMVYYYKTAHTCLGATFFKMVSHLTTVMKSDFVYKGHKLQSPVQSIR